MMEFLSTRQGQLNYGALLATITFLSNILCRERELKWRKLLTKVAILVAVSIQELSQCCIIHLRGILEVDLEFVMTVSKI